MKNLLMDSYLESMGWEFGGCDKLYDLSELCGKDGSVEMYHGDSVVFKVRDRGNGEVLALKFVVKDGTEVAKRYHHINEVLLNVESPYLVDYRVYDNVSDRKGTTLPVVVSEWVNGMRLNQYIEAHIEDGYRLELLAYRFCQMAWWLMEQPFAHGNLQPENILVTEVGGLRLVDYDGMFVPSLRGAREVRMGNCNFRRLGWKVEDFDERMDDFALVEMAMSLRAIAVKPELWKMYGGGDKLLLDWVDYSRLPGDSDVFNRILELEDMELSRLVDLFKRVCERGKLDLEERRGIVIQHPREGLDYVVEDPSGKDVCEKFLFNIRFRNGCPLYFKLDRMEGSVVVCSQGYYRDYEDEEFFYNDEEKAPFGEVVIPAEVVYRGRWYRVVGIEICAFVHCKRLERVVVPNSVERIEDEAFKDCRSLCSVTIPNSVRELGSSAFEGCRALRRIVLPPYMKNFNNRMFSECASMSEIVVPKGVRVVGSNMFEKCGELERVVMEGSVTEIMDGAFKGCRSLREVVLPKSVKRIGAEAFKGCEQLTELVLPKDLEEIGRGAFSGCKGLKVVALPKSVHRVDAETFKGCSGLERVILPGALEWIGEGAFEDCSSLKYALIFNSLGEIGAYAFKGCKMLQKLKLPNGVKRIGDGAFEDCRLIEEVDIPRSVESIGAHAFEGCVALSRVEVYVGSTQMEESSFPAGTEIVALKTRGR